MNATNNPGCDRNKKIFKKFASDLEGSRESILEADREASEMTVLEYLEATDLAKCPVCFAPITEENLQSHLFTSHYTEFYKLCSKSNKSNFHFAD